MSEGYHAKGNNDASALDDGEIGAVIYVDVAVDVAVVVGEMGLQSNWRYGAQTFFLIKIWCQITFVSNLV